MTSRVRWVQYNELAIGENHPTLADVDNRPMKDIILFSSGDPNADDFPGFLVRFIGGLPNPNGTQVGNIGNSYLSVFDASLWLKQTGNATNTGWVRTTSWDGCHLANTADIPLATGTTTFLTFDTEVTDTFGYHDPVVNPGRITIPVGRAGFYSLFAHIRHTTSGAVPATIELGIRKNGVTFIDYVRLPIHTTKAGVLTAGNLKCYQPHVLLAEGDYLELGAFHDTGGTEQAKGTVNNVYSDVFSAQFVGY